jgi:hypothetical protein
VADLDHAYDVPERRAVETSTALPGDGVSVRQRRPPSARWSSAFVIFERPRMFRSFASS